MNNKTKELINWLTRMLSNCQESECIKFDISSDEHNNRTDIIIAITMCKTRNCK